MISQLHPAATFILGALMIPLLRGRLKSFYMLTLPVLGFLNLISLPPGEHGVIHFLDFELVLLKVDRLNLVFGYIFILISFIAIVYVLRIGRNVEFVSGFVYAGSALGVVFSGDLFSFFVFWEMLTIGAVFLIWARKTKASTSAGFRYLLVHVFGGLVLLAGIVMYVHEHASIEFGYIGLQGLSTYFIFFGIGINCAWPFLHPWLPDSYPEATIGGTVFLSAFTTKTAVYALARTFPGTEILIWIGVGMAIFTLLYAAIENDLRRVLSYNLINQVGFMVVGIGIGTELSINGATAHAFSHILYKALLFMSVGAVMYRTGKVNATDLGGLYKCMPRTALFCMIGAMSISFPFFCGFVSKSMIIDAVAHEQMQWVWLVLITASAGVFLLAGLKVSYFAFFSHDAGHRVEEAPPTMLIAMGITALLSVFVGVYPRALYSILPYQVSFEPYTITHVLSQAQLLFFSAFAFILLIRSGVYPAEMRAVNLDFDVFYRKGGRLFYEIMDRGFNGLNRIVDRMFVGGVVGAVSRFSGNVPELFLLLFLIPYWTLTGLSVQERERRKDQLYKSVQTGALSVGLIAISVVIYLSLLFFL